MALNIINQDILTVTHGVIIQQVNCQGVMGAGLAKKIADKWPVVKKQYLFYCQHEDIQLGAVQFVSVEKSERWLRVANLFGQWSYGRGKCHTSYRALANGFNRIAALANYHNLPVYLPHGIGCGLAGGDWRVVSALIEQELPDAVICRWDEPNLIAPLPRSLVQG